MKRLLISVAAISLLAAPAMAQERHRRDAGSSPRTEQSAPRADNGSRGFAYGNRRESGAQYFQARGQRTAQATLGGQPLPTGGPRSQDLGDLRDYANGNRGAQPQAAQPQAAQSQSQPSRAPRDVTPRDNGQRGNAQRGGSAQRDDGNRRDFNNGNGRNDNDRNGFNRGNDNRRGYDNRDYGNRGFENRGNGRNGNVYNRGYDRGRAASYRRNWTATRRFYAPSYRRPYGWYSHRWRFGEFLPSLFFARQYWIGNYDSYALDEPPYGYEWVRYGEDALLVDIATGEVVQVVYDIFY